MNAPIIARLGGLPASSMEAFSTSLGERLDLISRLEASLQAHRSELVERLYELVHNAEPEKRHALLALKRDCFNGRPLARHAQAPVWRFVEEAVGGLAQRILALEGQLGDARSQFESAFQDETRYQRHRLAAFLDAPLFQCGLAIASPVVATEAGRLRRLSPDEYGRREKRLVATLLRYVSRAALKVSPFSTFTPVGICHVDEPGCALGLAPESWQYESLVRLRRHVFDRCADMLVHYRPWRERLEVALNNSISRMGDGRLLLRRSGHYRLDADKVLRHQKESLVRISPEAFLVEPLQKLLASGTIPYGNLPAVLASDCGVEEPASTINNQIEHLIDIGFLCLLPPWNTDEGHIEKPILRELRRLPATPGLTAFLTNLDRLIQLEDGLFAAGNFVADLEEINRLVTELLRGAAEVSGMLEEIQFPAISIRDVYQDVWCGSQSDNSAPILHAARKPLEKALQNVEPLVRYARLYDHQMDFLFTLGALLRERQCYQMPVLEALNGLQPLWHQFIKVHVPASRGENWRDTWNPLGLEILKELASTREFAYEQLNRCITHRPDGSHVSVDTWNALLDQMPRRFTEAHTGACLFLQPATADGSLWMLNRLKEGTGRFASRYTPLMPSKLRNEYQTELKERGVLEIDGEEVELLDVQHAQGDTLNIHAPQTPKILVLPGARPSVAEERQLSLSDLFVTLQDDAWPQLRDRHGRRYLPVYLGVGSYDYMPTLIKFLCAFGPTELMAVFPPPFTQNLNGVVVQERTIMGNVVLHRKTWRVAANELRACLECPSDSRTFAALYRWRQKREIPERVFVSERVPHPMKGFRYKPQYVDFTSPLFLPLLRSVASADDEFVTVTEMLPAPDAFLKNTEGQTWAVELLVDSASMRPRIRSREPQAGDSAKAAVLESAPAFVSTVYRGESAAGVTDDLTTQITSHKQLTNPQKLT